MHMGNGAVRDRGRISRYVRDLVAIVLPCLVQVCPMKFCSQTYGSVNWILKSFKVIKGKESGGKGLNVGARSQAWMGCVVSKTCCISHVQEGWR